MSATSFFNAIDNFEAIKQKSGLGFEMELSPPSFAERLIAFCRGGRHLFLWRPSAPFTG